MITYRKALPSDALALLETRRNAVLRSATQAYPRPVLEAWAPAINDETIRQEAERLSCQDRVTIVAEADGNMVGLGTVNITEGLLQQCYVLPEFRRLGIARELVKQIETIAKEHGLQLLKLSSSLVAMEFYRGEGYAQLNSYHYDLGNGLEMLCVMMEKKL